MAGAALVGGGIAAFGQIQEGKQAQEAQNFNASISEQEAGLTRENAILNEYRERKALRKGVGSMISGYAGSGVSVSTGSPLDAIADSIANAELDISLNKYNSEAEAKLKESEAMQMRKYGTQARTGSYYKAGSTLLTAGTTAYSRFAKEKIGA
jgi:hypothetical protein